MTTKENAMTGAGRRAIVAREISKARRDIAAKNGGHLSGQQVAAAKGIGRKRAVAIIDGVSTGSRLNDEAIARRINGTAPPVRRQATIDREWKAIADQLRADGELR